MIETNPSHVDDCFSTDTVQVTPQSAPPPFDVAGWSKKAVTIIAEIFDDLLTGDYMRKWSNELWPKPSRYVRTLVPGNPR